MQVMFQKALGSFYSKDDWLEYFLKMNILFFHGYSLYTSNRDITFHEGIFYFILDSELALSTTTMCFSFFVRFIISD
jgi:hypothetical protein